MDRQLAVGTLAIHPVHIEAWPIYDKSQTPQLPTHRKEVAVKLHLGCGKKYIPGYIHIDAQPLPHVHHVRPVEDLSLFTDCSIEVIYASHVLEHFGRHEYLRVLKEWYRVLRPGGLLRVGVPDFRSIAEEYASGHLENGLRDLIGLCVGGQRDDYDYHKMVFDEVILTGAFEHAGFSRVQRWDWHDTEHSSLDDYTQAHLPHMNKKDGRLMSLNLEAIK
ncbi:class I SAM-dependent methyltransferase [Kribbella sp. NPDC051587]|uniref:class I SAM-dependent methyltransferase n=1 Tax=Kribbella sp. NPDC051587 TaxID=3364119 RepID=UPI0037AA2E35